MNSTATLPQCSFLLTLSDHPLQVDDVLVVELAHDGGLGQEVLPLLLRVARLQGLDGHRHVPAPCLLQDTAEHLAKLTLAQEMK